MKKTMLTVALAAAAAAMLGAQAQSPAMNAKERANLQHVLNWWLECLEGRNLEATAKYQADGYIQHNINFPTGRAGFMKIFGERFKAMGGPVTPPPTKFANPPVVEFSKGDFVVLVWEREAKDPTDATKTYKFNTYDMLRIENGKVAEHWDYAIKAKGTPRGGAPDGIDYEKVKFDQTPQEQKNLEIATVEFKDILQYGHTELAEKVMAPTYIQHNPNVPTGRAAFVEFFSRIRKPEPLQAGWKNKPTMMFASGPYVFVMVKRMEKDPDDPAQTYPAYWFDLVRVDNGMVQEHWDSATKTAPPAAGR
jgi:predicted SnoaL-like aldol condensation-catalyzing enzyme